MNDVIASLTSAFTLAFVVTSMFGLGLGLTLKEVLKPLKNARLVLSALAANFIVMPGVAYLVTRLFPADPDLKTGIILLSVVAGAPLAVKASQLARGDMHFAASLVALQASPAVFVLLIAASLISMILVMLVAGEFGRRAKAAGEPGSEGTRA